MITTVTLNPAIDITMELSHFVANEYNPVEKVYRIPGGKGINISKAIRVFDIDTMALGFLGGHAGHFVAEQLREYGITTNFWHIEEETRTNVIVIEQDKKTHTLLSDLGPKITEHDLQRFIAIFSRVMAQSKIVAISGSLPKDVPSDIYRQLIEIAHEKNVRTILDAPDVSFEKGLEAKPFLAKPDLRASKNRIFNKQVDSQETAINIAHEIVNRGVQIAVISYQDTKDIIATSDKIWLAESVNQQAVNIVGTAEAVIAGFAIKLVREKSEDMEDIIKFAMACGLASALTDEEEFHTKEDVKKCLSFIKVSELK
jgi:1-phosphofructokinase family hexose kinase